MNTFELVTVAASLGILLLMIITYRRHIEKATDNDAQPEVINYANTMIEDVSVPPETYQVSVVEASVVVTQPVEAVKKVRKPRRSSVEVKQPVVEAPVKKAAPSKKAAPAVQPKKAAPKKTTPAPKKTVEVVAPAPVKKQRRPRKPKQIVGD
jgi:hypothetical protein